MLSVRLAALLSTPLMTGCFFLNTGVPDIPSTARPNLPPDKFLDLDARTVSEEVNYKVKIGETCVGSTCAVTRANRTKDVDVRIASGTIDGRPVSIRELAVMASPEFVSDTNNVDGLMSACRRGRILMATGATATIAGLTMLQIGFDEDKPNRNLAIAGYASLGVAVVGLFGGWLLFGGQHCKEASSIYERWAVIYKSPDDTKLREDAAEMYEVLAKKFNADRKAAGATETTTTEPPVEEEAP